MVTKIRDLVDELPGSVRQLEWTFFLEADPFLLKMGDLANVLYPVRVEQPHHVRLVIPVLQVVLKHMTDYFEKVSVVEASLDGDTSIVGIGRGACLAISHDCDGAVALCRMEKGSACILRSRDDVNTPLVLHQIADENKAKEFAADFTSSVSDYRRFFLSDNSSLFSLTSTANMAPPATTLDKSLVKSITAGYVEEAETPSILTMPLRLKENK